MNIVTDIVADPRVTGIILVIVLVLWCIHSLYCDVSRKEQNKFIWLFAFIIIVCMIDVVVNDHKDNLRTITITIPDKGLSKADYKALIYRLEKTVIGFMKEHNEEK